eukprot:3108331-Prymnesium_polylepis.1
MSGGIIPRAPLDIVSPTPGDEFMPARRLASVSSRSSISRCGAGVERVEKPSRMPQRRSRQKA